MKSKGYIDAASIACVASALSFGKPEDWTRWFLDSSLEVTSFLLASDRLRVAPAPDRSYAAHDLFGTIMTPLYRAGIVYNARIPAPHTAYAERSTKQWIAKNISSVATLFSTKLPASEDFLSWRERTISDYFVTHVKMHGALFNREFIPEISLILDVPKQDLSDIWVLSKDPRQARKWRDNQERSEDSKIAHNAYILSALLRGRYHDTVARQSRIQILHHPVRRNELLPIAGTTDCYKASNTEAFLATFVLVNSFSEHKIHDRIRLWSDKIVQIRELVRIRAIDLSPKVTEEIARDYVLAALHASKLASFSKSLSRSFDFLSSVLISGSYFLLSRWSGAPSTLALLAGPTANIGIKMILGKTPGQSISHSIYNTRGHLSDMLDSLPGRIESRPLKQNSK